LILHFFSLAQYPPPAGQPGSTAIFRDSSILVNWAKTCSIQVGYINIADTSVYYAGSNKANFGTYLDGIGKADDHVVSLGDGGIATLSFDPPISNGKGFDFAVFENGLSDNFLELGFVEVSSDGNRFVRLPSVSLTQDTSQISTFGFLDAVKINNLAGKYRVLFGTPFDLEEVKDSSSIDLLHIRQVRIIDVGGSLNPLFASHDSYGHIINDPWPTPFNTGGFDLDAVGVIHEDLQSVNEPVPLPIRIFPMPVEKWMQVVITSGEQVSFSLYNVQGEIIERNISFKGSGMFDFSSMPAGVYIGLFTFRDGRTQTQKIIKL